LRGERPVEAWRTSDDHPLLWMRGLTHQYRVDPLAEYVIGIASGAGYYLHRGRSTHHVGPGDLVVLDPSTAHSGSAVDGRPWLGQLVLVDITHLRPGMPRDLELGDPVIRRPDLARRFAELHNTARPGAPSLEVDGAFHDLVTAIAGPIGPTRRPGPARPGIGVRAAIDRLHDDVAINLTLDQLAATAGMRRFTFARRFKQEVGVAPHTYQIALRVQLARRLLEAGHRPADAAARVGFTDQSHLNRHFRKIGLTPAAYTHAHTRVDR